VSTHDASDAMQTSRGPTTPVEKHPRAWGSASYPWETGGGLGPIISTTMKRKSSRALGTAGRSGRQRVRFPDPFPSATDPVLSPPALRHWESGPPSGCTERRSDNENTWSSADDAWMASCHWESPTRTHVDPNPESGRYKAIGWFQLRLGTDR